MRLAGKKIGGDSGCDKACRTAILKETDTYGCTKRSGCIPTVDQTTKRHVRHFAADENVDCREINIKVGLNITKHHVQQPARDDKGLRYGYKFAKPRLSQRQKNVRIPFADKYKFWEEVFGNILFNVDKIF